MTHACTPVFIAAPFTIARTWKQPRCIYNGILLRHKKEQNNPTYSSVDGPRDCHIEWSKSDRGRQVSHDTAYKCINYTHTYIHSFSDYFPIKVITEYWEEFPMLYRRFFLVIYFIYTSMYMLISNSQLISSPPVFPSGNCKFVFYIRDSISAL